MPDRAARFDRLYAEDPDPWKFRTSGYEREKYRATLAAFPRPRYRLGIEAGCSIGELTRLVAGRCDRLIAVDVSEVALTAARKRNGGRPDVVFLCAELPAGWPDIEADLILLSEVLYFLDAAEIDLLAGRIAARWAADGDCVLVNYLGETGEALQGAEAADLFIEALARRTGASLAARHGGDGYRIDVLRRRPA